MNYVYPADMLPFVVYEEVVLRRMAASVKRLETNTIETKEANGKDDGEVK